MKNLLTRIILSTSLMNAGQLFAENIPGFSRDQFGSVVLRDSQNFDPNVQLELSIGNYQNEPILNYSKNSIFAQMGKSVGRLDVMTDIQIFPCTAFIISEKHILTNYHCSTGLVKNKATKATRIDAMQFVAGYLQTGVEKDVKTFTVVPTPLEFSAKLDYAVHEVIGNPSEDFGVMKLSNKVPEKGDPFWIIGHPLGEAQRISREQCKAADPAVSEKKVLHTCDTLPGNSGSPVIDAGSQSVVALHHAGSRHDEVNFGILMSEILASSQVIVASIPKEIISDTEQLSQGQQSTKACDALFQAAQSAAQCYAYDAYSKTCSKHALLPIAAAYMNQYCNQSDVSEPVSEPSDEAGQLILAAEKSIAKNPSKTIDIMSDFLVKFPNDERRGYAKNLIATAQSTLGENKLAARTFLNAFSENPEDQSAPLLLFGLGKSLFALGQFNAACKVMFEVDLRYSGSESALSAVEMRNSEQCS